MKTDPYSALDKPQKHTLRGRTSGRSFTLSAPPPPGVYRPSFRKKGRVKPKGFLIKVLGNVIWLANYAQPVTCKQSISML